LGGVPTHPTHPPPAYQPGSGDQQKRNHKEREAAEGQERCRHP